MSFYEDMGLRQGASAEEVREQYRVLVRLFHPDQFADPVLKSAAEGQLRRFNEIEGVLTDPARRRAYDLSLLAEHSDPPIVIHAPPPVRPERRVPWGSLAWGAAAMACAGAIVWVSDHETPPAPVFELHQTGSPGEAAYAKTYNEDWRARARTAILERDQALRELARLRGGASEQKEMPSAPQATANAMVTSEAAAEPPAVTPMQTIDTPKTENPFAGTWFYTPHGAADAKLYAPEFIETQISGRDGQVRGRYRSRYRVTDRAISPSVNFEFSGSAAGTSAQLPFVRDDGARGEVHLRLISDHEMELAWTANGTAAPSLTSGTAVLLRAQ